MSREGLSGESNTSVPSVRATVDLSPRRFRQFELGETGSFRAIASELPQPGTGTDEAFAYRSSVGSVRGNGQERDLV